MTENTIWRHRKAGGAHPTRKGERFNSINVARYPSCRARPQGLSLADLAERTKLDSSILANWEAGRMPNPTLQALRADAHALGKQLSWTIQDAAPTT
ncbi:MAG: multiprotein-bridging factor 1 family protein [Isosphaerales bacterium]